MFSSSDSFKSIDCPFAEDCKALNCIFRHKSSLMERESNAIPESVPGDNEPRKRRRVDPLPASPPKDGSIQPGRASEDFVGSLIQKPATPNSDLEINEELSTLPSTRTSLKRPISPPPLRGSKPNVTPTSTSEEQSPKLSVATSLNPRTIPSPPASHQMRLLYTQKLHEAMQNLNELARVSGDSRFDDMVLDEEQLNGLALDEEERIARENPDVYANEMRSTISKYLKKMSLQDWFDVLLLLQKRFSTNLTLQQSASHDKLLETGLSLSEELSMARHLAADQRKLHQYGYVVAPPSESDIKTTKLSLDAAQGWELCDRCQTRFRVFPDRNEEGALTTGGRCTYHYRRAVKETPAGGSGSREKIYPCCNSPISTPGGCVTAESHVFKISDPNRLAAVLQFECTPENPSAPIDRAIAFDCEMGYTVFGLELIRLTAISWPHGEELLDVLVRPMGTILDLNTRASGVTPKDMLDALPYGDGDVSKGLRIVESPAAARELLYKLISPDTPLIGHSIENDLNVMRMVHPCIVDTVLLYPHRGGLPYRRALKALAKEYLERDIQTGGSQGHDSREDALATGDLVRVAAAREWKSLKEKGRKVCSASPP